MFRRLPDSCIFMKKDAIYTFIRKFTLTTNRAKVLVHFYRWTNQTTYRHISLAKALWKENKTLKANMRKEFPATIFNFTVKRSGENDSKILK